MTTTDYTDNPEWIKPPSKEIITFRFRHYRDSNNKLFATTCSFVSQDNIIVAVGISICSDKDNFNRKIGRSISYGRGMKAYLSKMNHFPITKRDCPAIKKCLDFIGSKYKGTYLKII